MKKKIILSILIMLFPMATFGFVLKITNSPASDTGIELQTMASEKTKEKTLGRGPGLTLSPGKTGVLEEKDKELSKAGIWGEGQFKKIAKKKGDLATIINASSKLFGESVPQYSNLQILAIRDMTTFKLGLMGEKEYDLYIGAIDLAAGKIYNLSALVNAAKVAKNENKYDLDKDFFDLIEAARKVQKYKTTPGVWDVTRGLDDKQKKAWEKAKKSAQQAFDNALNNMRQKDFLKNP